jgi:ABC-type uncharacterized transport system substrate-binding protein
VKKVIFRLTLCALLLALSIPTKAQQPKKVPRIGYQSGSSSGENNEEAFRQGLRELGYIEGRNIIIEWRFAQGKPDQILVNAAELVRMNVDVIVTGGAADTRAAKEVTSTIPIVMTNETDPVGYGLIASLSRPGGNITGLASLSPDLRGKLLELLVEIIPRLSQVAVLQGPGTQGSPAILKETELVARSFGIKVRSEVVKNPDDLGRALERIGNTGPEALMTVGGPFATAQRRQIVEFAAKRRLPAIYYRKEFVEDGGLMSNNANRDALARRAAVYVDKILKGAKPADLPVEQPMKFEFVINLKTAKQIGVTIPPNVLARADRVIR